MQMRNEIHFFSDRVRRLDAGWSLSILPSHADSTRQCCVAGKG